MQVACALSLWIPSRILRSIVYYCVLCATLQGLVTPSVAHDFPSWTYFAFFFSHGVTVIAALPAPGPAMEAGAVGLPVGPPSPTCIWPRCIPSTNSWAPLRLYGLHARLRIRAGPAGGVALVPAVDADSGPDPDVPAHTALPPLSQGPYGQFPVPELKNLRRKTSLPSCIIILPCFHTSTCFSPPERSFTSFFTSSRASLPILPRGAAFPFPSLRLRPLME